MACLRLFGYLFLLGAARGIQQNGLRGAPAGENYRDSEVEKICAKYPATNLWCKEHRWKTGGFRMGDGASHHAPAGYKPPAVVMPAATAAKKADQEQPPPAAPAVEKKPEQKKPEEKKATDVADEKLVVKNNPEGKKPRFVTKVEHKHFSAGSSSVKGAAPKKKAKPVSGLQVAEW